MNRPSSNLNMNEIIRIRLNHWDFMKSTYFQTAINKYTVELQTALFKSFPSVQNSKISDLAQFKRITNKK